MAVQPEVPARLSFGPFEFDPGTGDLIKHGIKLRLQGQPLQILTVLIARPGQVVSREELQRRIWPASAFGDFEHGLNAAVNKLRQTLSDSAEEPRYVETIAGRGYRFIAALKSQPKPVIELAPPVNIRTLETAGPRSRWWILAGLALAAIAGIFYWIFAGSLIPEAPLNAIKFSVSPPPGYAMPAASSRQSLALSPDGTQLAFTVIDSGETYSSWIRKFSELEPKQVPESIGARTIFWSDDGKSLFFAARGKVRRTSLDGSPSQVISDLPNLFFGGTMLRPDAVLLSASGASRVVSLVGKKDEEYKDKYVWANVLPNNSHILYVEVDRNIGKFRALAGRIGDPSKPKEILISDARVIYAPSARKGGIGHLLFVRSGTLLAQEFDPTSLQLRGDVHTVAGRIHTFATGAADFAVSRNGVLAYLNFLSRSQMAWIDRQGKRQSSVGPNDINVKFMSISPDGHKVAASIYDVERGANDLWIYDLGTGAGRKLVGERGHLDNPIWSPDSKSLVYFRGYAGRVQMYRRGIEDHDPEEALTPGSFPEPGAWHPSGRYIAFSDFDYDRSATGQGSNIRLTDLRDRNRDLTIINTSASEFAPKFSPDGKWIAYLSTESGRSEIYVQAFEAGDSPKVSGDHIPVTRDGSGFFRWRGDGKEIVYIGKNGMIYGVPVKLSKGVEVGRPVALFQVKTEARAALHSNFGFDISKDGSRLLVPELSTAENSSVVVVQNWEALLLAKAR